MRLYAALSWSHPDNAELARVGYPWLLNSYVTQESLDRISDYRPKGLLLDSGAFSAWNSGATINLDDLIGWAVRLRDVYGAGETRLINLDVIPGARGLQPTAKEIGKAVAASVENAAAIRAAGLPVVEVYHGISPIKHLHGIIERRQPGELIALGGMGGLNRQQKEQACTRVFTVLRDICGGWGNLIPVHGLGMSGDSPLAVRFPWFSCDATTWFTANNYNNHIKRDGSFQARNRETAPRTPTSMSLFFMHRRIDRWRRYERQLTALWQTRGVGFIP